MGVINVRSGLRFQPTAFSLLLSAYLDTDPT